MKEYRLSIDVNKGLTPLKKPVRNTPYLSYSEGVFPEGNLLKSHEEITGFVHSLDCEFPYPQVFVLSKLVIVCTKDTIYEYSAGTFTQKLSGLTVGLPWSVADFFDYLYLTNGQQVVIRDSQSLAYAIDSTKKKGSSCLNLNGQLIVGGLSEINI